MRNYLNVDGLSVGDKIVCVNNTDGDIIYNLTIGKVYTIYRLVINNLNTGDYLYHRIVNDKGHFVLCEDKHFISMREYRSNIIDEILG